MAIDHTLWPDEAEYIVIESRDHSVHARHFVETWDKVFEVCQQGASYEGPVSFLIQSRSVTEPPRLK